MLNTKTIFSIAGVVVLALVIALASGAWNPSWNPFQATGGNAVEKALIRLLEAKSLETAGLLDFQVKAQTEKGQQDVDIAFRFSEAIDSFDKNNLKSKGTINLETSTEGINLALAFENILIGKDLYLKITTLPAVLPLGIDLSQFKNKWFKLDTSVLAQMLGSEASAAIDKQQAEQLYKDLLRALQGKEVFAIKKTLGKEEQGQHFLVEINKKAIEEVLPAFFDNLKKYTPKDQEQEFQQAIDSALADLPQKLDEFWAKTGGLEFDIWLNNGLPGKIRWQKQFQVADTQQLEQLGSTITSGSINATFEASFSGFNKKYDIAGPAEATPLEDILFGLLGDMTNLLPSAATSTN